MLLTSAEIHPDTLSVVCKWLAVMILLSYMCGTAATQYRSSIHFQKQQLQVSAMSGRMTTNLSQYARTAEANTPSSVSSYYSTTTVEQIELLWLLQFSLLDDKYGTTITGNNRNATMNKTTRATLRTSLTLTTTKNRLPT